MNSNFFIKAVTAVVVGVIMLSCDSSDPEITILDAQQASSQALTIVSGQVIDTDVDSTGVSPIWEVTVLTDAGAEVEVYFAQDGGDLIQIEGDAGPFDYDLDPGLGLISFSSAKQAALDAFEGEIVSWELEKDAQGNWIYEFEMVSNQLEETIKINASNGQVV